MASPSSECRSPAHPVRRAAAATVVACCIALFALIPAAVARSPHSSKGARASPAPSQTAATPEATEAPAGPVPAAATSAPTETTTASSGRPAPNAAPSPSRGQAKRATRRARREAAAQQEKTGPEEAAGRQTPAQQTPGQQAPGQPATPTPQSAAAQPTARGHHKGTRESPHHKEGTKGRHKESTGEAEHPSEGPKQGEQGQSTPTTPGAGDPAGTPTIAAAPLVEPAASLASRAATVGSAGAALPAAAPSPTVADTFAQASVSPRGNRSGSLSGTRRRAVAAKSARPRAPATAPAALAGGFARSGTSRSAARLGAGSTHKRAARAGRPLPLTTTITRIVDVVPTPVRVLIAALLALALALAVRSRVSALRTRRLQRQRVELLEDVGLLQTALLPVPPARLGPVGSTVAYKPAAGPGAGGDFYDVFALEHGELAVIVGDVSGHGREALPHTALVRFTLRAYLEAGLSPREAVQKAGIVLERQLGDQFATVVAATYNPRERVLVYACAGHPPPLVRGTAAGAGVLQPVTVCSSPPIGVGMRTGTRQTAVSVPGRSQVCFYTDGVTEARVGHELFGAERLLATLAELGPQATASGILDSVVGQADSRADDMAACLLGVEGGDGTPTVLVDELELDAEQAASARTERFLRACGVPSGETVEVLRAARTALARADTVVLELHRAEGSPRVALRRDHLSYLHARHENVEVYR
jgi:serine phosphatase RsbU (regulator of sigma subunit)